ncbi:MAG: RagB/SusD family nutrient uptake outer membrane protein [Tannerella sp.]|nr:RagB/SusD family nutrient uptake outer membrane protein [Tannerella sp.]
MIAGALVLSMSCSEAEFLKEEPRDNIYAENLLVDYAGFQSMITALQGEMRNEYRRTDYMANDDRSGMPISVQGIFAGGADNSWGNNIGNTGAKFSFVLQPADIKRTDNDLFEVIFMWLYKIVNTANMVISRAGNEDVKWGGATVEENQANKDRILSQACFARAWAYRHLTYTYGAVPLSTEEITGENYRTDWERDPVSRIRELMKADLRFAAEHLPLRAANNNYISGAMARHYLGELYLATDQPDSAIIAMKPLVESSEYALMTAPFGKSPASPACPFIDVFTSPSYADGNKEVLYYFTLAEPTVAAAGIPTDVWIKSTWKNYYSNDGTINKSNLQAPEYTGGALTYNQVFWLNNGGKGTARLSPSLGAIRLYSYKGMGARDMRVNEPAMAWKIWEKNADGNRVEFLSAGKAPIDTVLTAVMQDDTRTTVQNYKWPSTRKWDYTQQVQSSGDIDPTYADLVYLRLSDTYLLYAEALYESGNTGEAAAWINRVRQRAGVVDISATDLVAEGLDLILDERSRELLCEEERRHTLIRVSQKKGGNERAVDNYFKRRTRELNEIAGRDARGMNTPGLPVLLPVPVIFIDSNTGRPIEQNPGY